MLNFPTEWRFQSPASLPKEAVWKFIEYVGVISEQYEKQRIFEHFKTYFAGPAQRSYWPSSHAGFAESDLSDYMTGAADNAPRFIDAFYTACVEIQRLGPGIGVPDVAMINSVLSQNNAGFEIKLPYLVATRQYAPVPVPTKILSLDQQAQLMIENSLAESEKFLSQGHYVSAVQSVLWLLESFATAFNQGGEGDSVQGKYLNDIVKDLRRGNKGTPQDKILSWLMQLHDYLSDPDKGRVRHGSNIKNWREMQPHEAQLYCNLVRSYYTFLVAEHEIQLSNKPSALPSWPPS